MHYYRHNIGDFAALTAGMSNESVGILVRMIDRMVKTEKPIKTQWVSIGFPEETQSKAIAILESLFEETEEGYVIPELVQQIEEYQKNVEKNRLNGSKGGRPRKGKTQQKPSGLLEETQSQPSGKQLETLTNKPLTKEPKNQETKKGTPLPPFEKGEANAFESEPRKEPSLKAEMDEIVEAWNAKCENLPKVMKLSDARRKSLKARIEEYGKDGVLDLIDKTVSSDYLMGKVKDWHATFDWILCPSNAIKVLEGNYKNSPAPEPGVRSDYAFRKAHLGQKINGVTQFLTVEERQKENDWGFW